MAVTTITAITTTMTGTAELSGFDNASLYRLMAWLSPSYPVGAFSHSHGLEWAVEAGDVTDAATLSDWIEAVLRFGTGRQDAILLAGAWRSASTGDAAGLREVAELAAALAPSKERGVETMAQGRAFAIATSAAWPAAAEFAGEWDPMDVAYPIAVGAAAAQHAVALAPTLVAFLHAFAANLVSAGVRLVPLGQTDGQRVVAGLETVVAEIAAEARTTTLDDLGGCILLADIASMRHETQYTRLFRT
jgi:urease accessory protein